MNNSLRLSNKIVFITGATSGIGEHAAYEAAKEGAVLVLSGRRKEKLATVRHRCEKLSGKKAHSFQMDIADSDQIDHTMNAVLRTVPRIDVLVNSAGFGETREFLSFDFLVAEDMFRVNVLGLMYLTQLVGIQMAEQQSGHIFSVSSMAGKIATPKSTVYSATKFAVIGFSNALRLELHPLNIQVTTVNPGPVRTAFHDRFDPSGSYLESISTFVLEPEQVAKKIVRTIGSKKREINQPLIMEGAHRLYTLFPTIGDFLTRTLFDQK